MRNVRQLCFCLLAATLFLIGYFVLVDVEIRGQSYVGALVGYNHEGHVANSYSTGRVSGQVFVGGLVGYSGNANVISSYWDISASGRTGSAAGVGRTTAQMMRQETFLGWDFGTVWTILEGIDYPDLIDNPG